MDIRNILLFIVSIITAYLSLFILRGKKSYTNTVFSLFILSVGLWAFGISFFSLTDSYNLAFIYAKLYYIVAAAIPIFFLLFSLSFPKERKVLLVNQIIPVLIFVFLSVVVFFIPNSVVISVSMGVSKSVSLNLFGYTIYSVYFTIILLIAYINLFKSYLKYKQDSETATQLKFIIGGTIIPFVFGMLFDLILPVFTYEYIWIGPLFGFAVVLVVLYSVYKHHLFDAKVITAELFTFTLWIFILIRALVASDIQEKVINIGLLSITVVTGIFLIRSVRKEVETREKIQSLANDLSLANSRLRELDQQKSEFVSLASHQLRGPLTAVKGYSSMLLDGDFGVVSSELRDPLEKIYESVNDLTVVVGDYLDVSRIEQGRMQYDFTNFSLRDLVATVVTELKPNISRAKLSIQFDFDPHGSYMVNADQGKIKQVIGNLIDNAIKYTPQGGLHVWLSHPTTVIPDPNSAKGVSVPLNNKVLISISDTGVGIHPDVLPRLFEKFTRAPDASKTNIMGTGLGLYVARKIIEAHHGRIWAESPGAGQGSTFFIELDCLAVASVENNTI